VTAICVFWRFLAESDFKKLLHTYFSKKIFIVKIRSFYTVRLFSVENCIAIYFRQNYVRHKVKWSQVWDKSILVHVSFESIHTRYHTNVFLFATTAMKRLDTFLFGHPVYMTRRRLQVVCFSSRLLYHNCAQLSFCRGCVWLCLNFSFSYVLPVLRNEMNNYFTKFSSLLFSPKQGDTLKPTLWCTKTDRFY